MGEQFFERPILNSPYEYPAQHWGLYDDGQPANQVLETCRRCDFIKPIPRLHQMSIVILY